MIIVTGAYPPDICGVGDYSQMLYNALVDQHIPVELFYRRHWNLKCLRPYSNELSRAGDIVVNFQYPTEGYGYSIVPHLLAFGLRGKQKLVTLHEFTRKSLKGQLAIYLFFLSANWIVFTTEQEHEAACRVAPWIRRRSSVIQIASSIPMQDPQVPDADVTYFGLIRPGKGLEQFAEVTERLKACQSVVVRVVGQMGGGYEAYSLGIVDKMTAMGVELVLNRDSDEVSSLLSRSRLALLPFPDGLSFRRSSALAAMGNGALLVTTPPAHDAEILSNLCVSAKGADGLLNAVIDALNHPEKYEAQRTSGQAFARSIQWRAVARSYQEIADRLSKL
jgi:glycosyltransferase involved in cell wall biosynthesis